jgi:hypothetical protein
VGDLQGPDAGEGMYPLPEMPEYTFDTSQVLTAHRTTKVITFAEIGSVA